MTYPNVLVLDYLKRTKKVSPELQLRAEEFIRLGYQRLLSFQAADGGFALFGGQTADPFLTAFGLMEMSDMSRVQEVDPAVIERARRWLITRQLPDGSWGAPPYARHTAGQRGSFTFTAYAAWALAVSLGAEAEGRPLGAGPGLRPSLDRAAAYLRQHLEAVPDAYVLALVANALVAVDREDPAARRVLDTLAERVIRDGKAAHWSPGASACVMGARGPAADVETTALAVEALLAGQRHGGIVLEGLTYLIRAKDAGGIWGSTQATVLSLRALIDSAGTALQTNQGTVAVLLNGREVERLRVTPENSDVLQQLDLTARAVPGENRVELRVEGDVSALYQVVGRYYVPWIAGPPVESAAKPQGPLSIRIAYDRTELATDDTLTEDVDLEYRGTAPSGMVLVDLGIPPGFSVRDEDLAELRGSGLIQRYDVTGRQVILYLDSLPAGKPVRLRYRLQAKFPVRVLTPRSVAYEYYTPEVQAVAAPVALTVTSR